MAEDVLGIAELDQDVVMSHAVLETRARDVLTRKRWKRPEESAAVAGKPLWECPLLAGIESFEECLTKSGSPRLRPWRTENEEATFADVPAGILTSVFACLTAAKGHALEVVSYYYRGLHNYPPYYFGGSLLEL